MTEETTGQGPQNQSQNDAPGAEPSESQGQNIEELAEDKKLAAENAKWRTKFRDAESQIKALRGELKELKPAADKLKELEEAQLSEQERLTKQLEEEREARQRAETTAKQRAVRSALIAAAARLNFNDPADAYRMIDVDAIEFDDAGEPKNADKLVKELAENRKYLIKQGRTLEQFDPTGGEPIRETDAEKRARIYGGQAGIWNESTLVGGVTWPKGMPGTEE